MVEIYSELESQYVSNISQENNSIIACCGLGVGWVFLVKKTKQSLGWVFCLQMILYLDFGKAWNNRIDMSIGVNIPERKNGMDIMPVCLVVSLIY